MIRPVTLNGHLAAVYFSYIQTLTGLVIQVAVMADSVESYAAFFKAQTALVLVWAICNLSLRELDIDRDDEYGMIRDRSVMLPVFITFSAVSVFYILGQTSSKDLAIYFISIYGLKKAIDYVYETYSVRLALKTIEIKNPLIVYLFVLSVFDFFVCTAFLIDMKYSKLENRDYLLCIYIILCLSIVLLFYWGMSKVSGKKSETPRVLDSKRAFGIIYPVWSLIPRGVLSVFSTDIIISSFGMAMLPTVLIPPILSVVGRVKRIGQSLWLGVGIFFIYFLFEYMLFDKIYSLVGVEFVRSSVAFIIVAVLVSVRSVSQLLNSGKVLGSNISYVLKIYIMSFSVCVMVLFLLFGGFKWIEYCVLISPAVYLIAYLGIMMRQGIRV